MNSSEEFHQFPADYLHWIRPKSNTGIKLDLLQEYILIPLDIFRLNLQNRGIQNELYGDGIVFGRTENIGQEYSAADD